MAQGRHADVSAQRGMALVAALLAVSLFSALGMALAVSSSVDRLTAANHEDAVDLLNMADAALELAARELDAIANWNSILDGTVQSSMVDGPPSGARRLSSDVVIDLTGLTSDMTCGQVAGCTDAARMATTVDRPWGVNNPWWRPFLYRPLAEAMHPRSVRPSYVVVWLGDDASEEDGNPLIDGGGGASEGRYIVRARAVAFGEGRASRAIDAELARICTPAASGETCLPGIRVQSWRVLAAVP